MQVQSEIGSGGVKKLSYQAIGPFKIIEELDHKSFTVQLFDNDKIDTTKYKATELYLLLPALFPEQPLDTLDRKYLNY